MAQADEVILTMSCIPLLLLLVIWQMFLSVVVLRNWLVAYRLQISEQSQVVQVEPVYKIWAQLFCN